MAAALTVLWLRVVPTAAATADKTRSMVIRYGHPACWGLLCVVGAAYALGAVPEPFRSLSVAALIAYVAFLVALVK